MVGMAELPEDPKRKPVTLLRDAAPLRRQVTDLLREAIVSFSYRPGERLVEREMCDHFGVSRTVIREALRHLEAEGFVELVPGHGPVVSTITPQEARELYELREVLESLAAAYFAERATDEQKRALAGTLRSVKTAVQQKNLASELSAKDDFYGVLFQGVGNSVLVGVLRSIQGRSQVLRSYSLQTPGRAAKSLAELKVIVDAIERGDAKAASRGAAIHVRNAAAAAIESLNSSPADGVVGSHLAAS
jgi:DNA-binding GntR family transcriptional regulator